MGGQCRSPGQEDGEQRWWGALVRMRFGPHPMVLKSHAWKSPLCAQELVMLRDHLGCQDQTQINRVQGKRPPLVISGQHRLMEKEGPRSVWESQLLDPGLSILPQDRNPPSTPTAEHQGTQTVFLRAWAVVESGPS